jgi:hypothetical protein
MPRHHTAYDEDDHAAIMQHSHAMEIRNDADGIFLARELDYVKAQAYDIKYTRLSGMQVVPVVTDTPNWAETITYSMWDQVGMAKIVSNYADDLPRVDVFGREYSTRVKTIGDAYGYNLQEIEAARGTGKPLDSMKSRVARNVMDRKLNKIIWTGEANSDLQGALTHPNIGHKAVAAGAGGGTSWDGKTGMEMYTDLASAVRGVPAQSGEVHKVNRIVLPGGRLTLLQTTFIAIQGGSAMTVFAAFQQNFPGVTFTEAEELKGTAAGNTSSMFVGEFSAENMAHEFVQPFRQLPPQARNLEWVINCLTRTGGVVVRFPLAFSIVEGI